MSKLQRRVAAGLLAIGTMAGVAGTAHAAEKTIDHNERYQFVVTGVDNPCTPQFDDITLDTALHAISKVWGDFEDDSWRSQSHLNVHQAGSAADGTQYLGGGSFQAQARLQDGVVSISADTKNRLVSQGSDPNFVLRMKVLVTFPVDGGSSTWEVVKDAAECRG
jgi:hypothetical protein